MSDRTTIAVALTALCSVALLVGGPDLIITIRIPFWFKTIGTFAGIFALLIWLRRDFWRWFGPPVQQIAAFLADDQHTPPPALPAPPVSTRPYTGKTTRLPHLYDDRGY
jgi:hypothetical protein